MSTAVRTIFFSLLLLAFSSASFAQIGISVSFGPPAIPVYEQPICPGDGYIWTPGFWDYADDDYYWVPGTWILAPEPGFLWTPGYWGWGGSAFFFHEGYWGPHVGFYGGINYGFGYGGRGYDGGRWDHDHFYYNTYVNRVDTTIIRNTYNTRVENVTVNRISYNGGNGGVEARATSEEQNYDHERHIGRVSAQNEHIQQARSNPELRATANQGRPPIAATSRPSDFKSGAVPAKEAGAPYHAPDRAQNNTQNNNRPPNASNNHASDLQPHKFDAPNTGNPSTDKKYQQQQDKLVAKQAQDHQKLQQQQEKDHQQAAKRNADAAQQQQMEQRHTQQTQQLEQRHTNQQQQVQAHQQPHQQSASHPQEQQQPQPHQ
jgi:hypothetical protein